MEQRLSLITLGVDDLVEARAFYARLGWRESAAGGADVAFFQLGGIALGLYGRNALADEAGVPDTPGRDRFGGTALAYNVRERDDVDAVLAEAVAAGGRLLRAGEARVWGGYTGYFADPEGHVWEVAWNPFFPIVADGSLSLPD
jgi:uncharacterized protein